MAQIQKARVNADKRRHEGTRKKARGSYIGIIDSLQFQYTYYLGSVFIIQYTPITLLKLPVAALPPGAGQSEDYRAVSTRHPDQSSTF